MTTTNADGGAGHHPDAPVTSTIATATKPQDRGQPSRPDALPAVHAVLLLAVAGALYDRLLVRVCALCGCAHLHYLPVGGSRSGIVRAPRCAPHRRYVVEVSDVLPVALAAGQRKRAGAA